MHVNQHLRSIWLLVRRLVYPQTNNNYDEELKNMTNQYFEFFNDYNQLRHTVRSNNRILPNMHVYLLHLLVNLTILALLQSFHDHGGYY